MELTSGDKTIIAALVIAAGILIDGHFDRRSHDKAIERCIQIYLKGTATSEQTAQYSERVIDETWLQCSKDLNRRN